MNNKKNKTYEGRRKVSIIMFLTFILLIPSGIIMHFNDSPGANSIKHLAMVIHNISALVFVISGLFHLKFNYALFKKYFSGI